MVRGVASRKELKGEKVQRVGEEWCKGLKVSSK
jgi:hypothetical protein